MKHAVLLLVLCGCARFSSVVTETESPSGDVQKVTRVRAYTLFDGKSELAKVSSGQTASSQKVSIGSLNQEASTSNAVSLAESVVGAAVRAAVRP